MAVVAAPFLYFVMQNWADVPPQIHDPAVFSHDPLNYLLPSEWAPGRSLFWITIRPPQVPTGDNGGYDAYLGLPLILILILQLRELRRRPYLKPLLLSLLAIVILSLGPALHVAGVSTRLSASLGLALHLPLINQALPNRFSMYVALAAGLTAALWLSAAGAGGAGRALHPGRARMPLPFTGPCVGPPLDTPASGTVFRTSERRRVHRKGCERDHSAVLGPGLLWQWQSGMRFTQSGGYPDFARGWSH